MRRIRDGGEQRSVVTPLGPFAGWDELYSPDKDHL
jgi:hypothetical protein